MNASMILSFERDINDPLITFWPATLLARGDQNANIIKLTVMDGNEPADLSGNTAVVLFQRPGDSYVVRCPGSVSGNVISVTLLGDCYLYAGQYYASLILDANGFTRTMLRLAGQIESNGDGPIIDPTGTIPGYEDLARIYAELEESLKMADAATDGANEAAKNANENAELANEAAGNANAAADSADEATIRANEASESIEGLTVEASDVAYNQPATATVTDVEGHKHIAFGLRQGVPGAVPSLTFTGETGEPNTDVVITQSGPPEAPIVNLKIPQGVPGTGNVSTVDGLMPGSGGDVDLNAVRYVAQTLDDAQKQQAMNNIGAMSVSAFPYIIGAPLWGDGGADLSAAFSSADALYDAVSSNNFRYIRNGDYWPLELNGSFYDFAAGETKQLTSAIFKLQANVNTFLMYGNGSIASLQNPHILFVSADAFPMTLQYRPDSASWYNQAATNPWLGSALYETLNNKENGILSILLETSIGPYIYAGTSGSGISTLLETKGKGVTSATGYSWQPRGRLFLPTEHEIAGGPTWASVNFGQGVPIQWPIFNASSKNMIKGLGNGASSTPWWTQSSREGDSTTFVYVGAGAIRGDAKADVTVCSVPLCFVFGGD